MTLRVGLIQTRTPASHAAALAHVTPLIRQAATDGASFIATPEGTNILQKDKAALLPRRADQPFVNHLAIEAVAKGKRTLPPVAHPFSHTGSA